ncbi:MAG: glycosyltransferase family 39 protein [bacterium]|nr:glycosyltransferase family 39 protein [bacterium]
MSKKKKKSIDIVPTFSWNTKKAKKVRKDMIVVFAAFALMTIFRLIFLNQIKVADPEFFQPTQGTDMGMYDQAAMDMVDGKSLTGPFFYHPLYYYFLSFNYFIYGHNMLILRLVMGFLGLLTCWMTYSMAKKIFNQQVAVIASILLAFCGYLIYYESVILSIGLTTFFATAAMFFLLKDTNKLKDHILSGIFIGLACLSQPNILLFVPFAAFWLIFKWGMKKGGEYAVLCLAAVFIIISPVTLKNYLDSGRFVLISTSGEVNFWLGNHKGSLGWFDVYGNELEALEKRVHSEGQSVYMDDVWQFIKDDPGGYLSLLIKKKFLFWGDWDIPHQVGYDYGRQYSSLLRLPFMLDFAPLAILGLAGLIISLRRYWKKCLLLYLFTIAYSFSVYIIMVHGRYRPPVLLPLIIFGSFFIWWLWEQIKSRKYLFLTGAGLLLCTMGAFVFSQHIMSRIICIKNQHGIYQDMPDKLVISDDSSSWHGLETATLNTPSLRLKKTFVIDCDPVKYQNARLSFRYFGGGTGEMYFHVNGKPSPKITLDRGAFLHKVGYKFTTSLLKKGVNEIIFEVIEGGILKIPIDNYYRFNRSFISQDEGKVWKEASGEYMIQMELLK